LKDKKDFKDLSWHVKECPLLVLGCIVSLKCPLSCNHYFTVQPSPDTVKQLCKGQVQEGNGKRKWHHSSQGFQPPC